MSALPEGTVSFLFTDVEGSTRLVQRIGDARFGEILETHHAELRRAVLGHGGIEVGSEGDSLFAVFPTAPEAVAAAVAAQRGLAEIQWPGDVEIRVRIGIHTGLGRLSGRDYAGLDVHRAARVAAAAAGGQVIATRETALLVDGQLPHGVTLTDLGTHRLRDLERPESLVQVTIGELDQEFRPISRAGVTGLPSDLPPVLGRSGEITEIARSLEHGRLVSVTGPGGSGKTRVCAAVAEKLADAYPDGVFFVELGSLQNPDHLVSRIGAGLGLPFTLYDGPAGLDKLAAHLSEKRSLLVLDNFEQILDAAVVVRHLLDATQRLAILVASRAPLQLVGELEYPLEPLPIPDASETDVNALAAIPSVALFVDRASRVRPDFALTAENAPQVVRVTRLLDGLPLALELAAARTKVLSLPAMAERLDDALGLLKSSSRDRPGRQQTISDAIAWSYDLLDTDAKRFFAAFSAFRGGARLDQIEEVWETNGDTIDAIGELVDQSLVRRVAEEGPRFAMFALINAYAAERLQESPEADQVSAAHARVYVALACDLSRYVLGSDRHMHIERLEEEHDNFRAALKWLIVHDPDDAARLGGALWRFWHMRGYIVEGLEWMERILDASPSPARRLEAVIAAGGLAYWARDMDYAARRFEEATALGRELGDRHGEAEGLYNSAFPPIHVGDLDAAARFVGAAGAIFEELDDEHGLGRCTWATGVWLRFSGDDPAAIDHFERAVEIFRRCDDVFHAGWALRMLGRAELMLGRTDDARGHLRESMAIFVEAGDLSGVALHLTDFCLLAFLTEQDSRAYELFGAKEMVRRISQTELVNMTINLIPGIDDRLARGGAQAERDVAVGEAMSLEDAIALALAT